MTGTERALVKQEGSSKTWGVTEWLFWALFKGFMAEASMRQGEEDKLVNPADPTLRRPDLSFNFFLSL